jgi:hypothetical protein
MARLFFVWWEPWCLPSGGNYKGYKGRSDPPSQYFPLSRTPAKCRKPDWQRRTDSLCYCVPGCRPALRMARADRRGRWTRVLSCNPCNGNLL